jgi:ribosomal protein S9
MPKSHRSDRGVIGIVVNAILLSERANLAAAKALDAYVPLTGGAYTTQAEAFREALRAAADDIEDSEPRTLQDLIDDEEDLREQEREDKEREHWPARADEARDEMALAHERDYADKGAMQVMRYQLLDFMDKPPFRCRPKTQKVFLTAIDLLQEDEDAVTSAWN